MTKSIPKLNPFMKIFMKTLVSLPAPANISTMWNFGSLLSVIMVLQLISGLLLAVVYSASMDSSFQLVSQMMETTDKGWVLRYTHANGASLLFIALYTHTGRGLYYGSFLYPHVWFIGVTILLLCMATAFMGYVLPINQMSYWGASVITSLFSEVPYIGPSLLQFIWGSSSVSAPTITRFFTFHFLLPFMMLALVVAHITFLHQTGSSNPLGLSSNNMKIMFNSYFSTKDLIGLFMVTLLFILLIFYYPLYLGDNENFIMANPSVTPQHIQPEWYFLFAYTILRSIPNKLGGVLALLLSVLILYTLPMTFVASMKSCSFYPVNKLMFWLLVFTILLLTWIGMKPVEEPYSAFGQILTFLYFSYFLINPMLAKMTDLVSL
uniref:Cytochrome b n=1 Tax=Gmelinoides fasciatus TaxID=686704 RepID=A0A1L5BW50_9CRUS|nr:cytochrome b [Gmelinoides fasciatus]APL97194.1 cytochrome b [Gmelinoides fasciatus]